MILRVLNYSRFFIFSKDKISKILAPIAVVSFFIPILIGRKRYNGERVSTCKKLKWFCS